VGSESGVWTQGILGRVKSNGQTFGKMLYTLSLPPLPIQDLGILLFVKCFVRNLPCLSRTWYVPFSSQAL